MSNLFRLLIFSALFGITFNTQMPAPANAETVGLVKMIERDAYGTPPNREREQKFIRFPVVRDEVLETGADAGMLVEFSDHTTLILGANARVEIDTFIYEPKTDQMTSIFNLTIGTLRYVSGVSKNANVMINTPTAAIGIRGSDILIRVYENGSTSLNVFSGVFILKGSAGGGGTIEVTAAQAVSVSAQGNIGTITPGAAQPTGGITAGGFPQASNTDTSGSPPSEADNKGNAYENQLIIKRGVENGTLVDDDGHHDDKDWNDEHGDFSYDPNLNESDGQWDFNDDYDHHDDYGHDDDGHDDDDFGDHGDHGDSGGGH